MVVQKEASSYSASSGHWALVMQGLDDFGKNRLGVVCRSQCRVFSDTMSTATGHVKLKKTKNKNFLL